MAMIPFGEQFPYTNTHDLNLDWIIRMVKELNEKFDKAISQKITFADPLQWDITKQYEALTIVLNGEMAYLSMGPVPNGIQITDTDYWQPVFDMSEFYDEIQDVKDELNDEIQDLSDSVSADIQELQNTTVKNNASKHILFCGDSYTTWYSGKLFNEFVTAAGLTPANCHNVAHTGAGFNIGDVTFLQQVQGYAGDKTEITDIIVCGGINDALLSYNTSADLTALENAILAFVSYCHTNYPNAKLHIAYVGGTLSSSTYYTTLHPATSQQWALWAYTVFAGGNGFNVLNTWNAIHSTKYNYYTDGLHPSENYGVVAIGQAVAGAFNDNDIITCRPKSIIQLQASGINTRPVSSFAWVTDDTFFMSTPDGYLSITENESVGADDWAEILKCNTYEIREPHFFSAMVTVRYFNSSSTPKQVPAEFMIRDGAVSIKVFSLSGSNYETLTADSGATISFPGFDDIQCPLWEVN